LILSIRNQPLREAGVKVCHRSPPMPVKCNAMINPMSGLIFKTFSTEKVLKPLTNANP